jgi:putative DNA primase/helicase
MNGSVWRVAEDGDHEIPKRAPHVLNGQELLEARFPERETLIAPWLPVRGLCMVVATRGIGKTWFGLNIALAVATGGEYLCWKAGGPRRVLYIDGEMPASALQERFAQIVQASGRELNADNFRIIAADLQELGIPSLATEDGREFLITECEKADLIIIDNIATLCGTGGENDADAWRPVQEWALRQRAAGRSVLFIHHASKSGGQRGTSAREDVLDTVISLRRPFDYSANQGARFEVHFTKARGFFGPDAEPFETILSDGVWTVHPIQTGDDLNTLQAMKDSGLSFRDIEERTGISKSTVQRMLKKGDDHA